ncbi:hypothetical protein NFI96_024073, partial [Prochilodus magdalenae]
ETQSPCQEQRVKIYGAKGQNTLLHCFTTDQETDTLNVTLYRQDGDEPNKLLYPASGLTDLQHRLSLQKDSGNMMFVLHNTSFSDNGPYKCEVHRDQDCLAAKKIELEIKDEPRVHPLNKGCENIGLFKAALKSTFKLQCPVLALNSEATEVIWGTIAGDQTVPITRCPPPCTFSRALRPLCERVKIVDNTVNRSLIISPVESIDAVWYWFTVNATSCYKFKLSVTDTNSPNQTTEGGSLLQQSLDSTEESPEINNLTVTATVASTVSICIVLALLAISVRVYQCFRKQKKDMRKIELENQYATYTEVIHNHTLYSLVQNDSTAMCTFMDQ